MEIVSVPKSKVRVVIVAFGIIMADKEFLHIENHLEEELDKDCGASGRFAATILG